MLTVFRRHLKSCKFALKGRKHRHCNCPLMVEGKLRGEMIRRSLDMRSWEGAQKLVRDMELHGEGNVVSLADAASRFLEDQEAAKLSAAMIAKYKNITDELKRELGENLPIRSVSLEDLRKIRQRWKLAPITMQKRLENLRRFFTFCLDSGWIEKNPAAKIKMPIVNQVPTLPFDDQEMEKILWAVDAICEVHPKITAMTQKKLKGLILLMRWSGLRISDACMFKRSKLTDGKVFLRQEKTKQPVWVPVPAEVVKALDACFEGDDSLFYNHVGKPKSCITEWQQRLKLVYDLSGVGDAHSHRLRDSFAVGLLVKAVPMEHVSKLLGHKSIKTTEKSYAPWVKARQDALEEAVKGTW